MRYVELHLHSNFSFLDGASPPSAMVRRAAELGMQALAITDNQGVYGAVKLAAACREHGVKPIYGAEITVADDISADDGDCAAGHLTLLVESNQGWANLCRMLSEAGRTGTKHERPVTFDLLDRYSEGLTCLTGCREGLVAAAARRGDREETLRAARRLKRIFGPDHCYVELQRHFDRGDRRRNATLVALARYLDLPLVATNNVHYATPDGYRLQHVLTCIREHVTLDSAGNLLYATPHRYLKSEDEMSALFSDLPQAVANTVRIAERCNFELDLSHARFPTCPVPDGETPFSHLLGLCYAGLRRKYDPVTPEANAQLSKELGVIERCGLADYFLIVHDLVAFARREGILCQGRGSAAGSVVAYLLDITPVDPLEYGLLFERFLAEGSNTTPDIDIDFASDRREEVIQYVYERYGADYTAMVANVVTFRSRSAMADVGKALGFPADLLSRIRDALYTRSADDIAPDLAEVAEFSQKMTHLPWQLLLDMCAQIANFPRHLSIHVGGMIVTGEPLAELVPLEPATMERRVVVQWDKDDVEDAGLIKIDLLSLGTLSLVAESFDRVRDAGGPDLNLDNVPQDDPQVWEMLAAADAIGLFQVESRAQMSLLPRLRPKSMEDLAVEVALIRPGPIQGGMAKAYLRRRDGEEPITYWHPSLESVLDDTLGVLVYQEQVLRVSMAVADFSGAQADGLRRAMGRKRSHEAMETWRGDFVVGAMRRGLSEAEANDVYDKLLGFASYGFCKSHAASFARLSYITAWLKWYHPGPFYCGLLNAQPMGFYSVEVIVEDAKRHGIKPLGIDVNRSWTCWEIEGRHLRVPLTRLRGMHKEVAERIVELRERDGPFRDLWDFIQRTSPPRYLAERLIRAGALDFTGHERRQLLWRLGDMQWGDGELGIPPVLLPAPLPASTARDEVASDYGLLGLAQGLHILSLYRPHLAQMDVITSSEAIASADGEHVRVAGRVEVVQRPQLAKGIVFGAIEDETGMVNLLMYPAVYERFRSVFRESPVIVAEGRIQHEHGALHIIIDRLLPVELGEPEAGEGEGLRPEDIPPPAKLFR